MKVWPKRVGYLVLSLKDSCMSFGMLDTDVIWGVCAQQGACFCNLYLTDPPVLCAEDTVILWSWVFALCRPPYTPRALHMKACNLNCANQCNWAAMRSGIYFPTELKKTTYSLPLICTANFLRKADLCISDQKTVDSMLCVIKQKFLEWWLKVGMGEGNHIQSAC